jgi:acyl-CoA dehydrogenase
MLDVVLNDDERAVRDEARAFAREAVDPNLLRAMDADEVRYPREYVQALGEAGLLGLRFDPRWGGRGMGWTAETAVLEEIGALGSSLGCLYSLPSIVGEALHRFGTDAQKEQYLRPTLAGELCCAEALTEPRGGSDFFGATCRAQRRGDVFVLEGAKRFIVGGEGADYFLVYARTGDDEAHPHQAISAFLIEREMGVQVEYLYGLMGTRGGGTARISFPGIEVPATNLVGELHGGAAVFNRMMVPERMTSAAGSLGPARAALEIAVRYADRRKAFGKPIRRYQAVSFQLADAATKLDAARGLVHLAARTADDGRDARRLVSEAKKFATTSAWEVINIAMQVLGGIGYTTVYPVERMLRDARLPMIWTGSNEIMDLLIQHELFAEILGREPDTRDAEADAGDPAAAEEKVYE